MLGHAIRWAMVWVALAGATPAAGAEGAARSVDLRPEAVADRVQVAFAVSAATGAAEPAPEDAAQVAPGRGERERASLGPLPPLGDPLYEKPMEDRIGLGEDKRFPHMNVFLRFANDLVAIPVGIAYWDEEDWGRFVLFATPVVFLMLGPPPSVDVKIQDQLNLAFPLPRFRLWNDVNDRIMWASIWAATMGTLGVGFFAHQPPLVETVSLMLEAFALAQVGQFVFKIPLGREGPGQGSGMGLLKGPAEAIAIFPGGTPSGHAATLYAMLGVVCTYWDSPWITVPLNVFGAFFSTMLVVDNYHYLSDVIWGAAMGWYFGEWVVHHRSSRFTYRGDEAVRVSVLPAVDPEAGRYGLTVSFAF